jgi:thiol-disulfide isomerase/thioredoxin
MARFQKYYPNDRRLAPLIAEIATLYDEQPKHKALLLRQALEAARDENTRARVLDDLKRLELLGHPLVIDGTTAEGTPVTTAEAQGKVVAVYFFASWSPPSVAGLEEVAYLRQTFPPEQLEVIGVSLDPTRESLEKLTKAHPFLGLVIWDGKGWESPLIRRLALNALPTLWILDRKGNLRTLNARTESEALIRRLLKEQP